MEDSRSGKKHDKTKTIDYTSYDTRRITIVYGQAGNEGKATDAEKHPKTMYKPIYCFLLSVIALHLIY